MTNCHIFQIVTLQRDIVVRRGRLADYKLKKGEKVFVVYYPIFAGRQDCRILADNEYFTIPKASFNQADQDACARQVIR